MMAAVIERSLSKAEAKQYNRALSTFDVACRYTEEHFDELVKRHANRWIAVHRTTVLGSATTTTGLLRVLQRSKRPPSEVCVTFLTRHDQVLIL